MRGLLQAQALGMGDCGVLNPKSKHNRNLHAVNAHFRRGGAFRDERLGALERLAMDECEEACQEAWCDGEPEVRQVPRADG